MNGAAAVSRKLAPKVAPPDKAEAYSDKDKWLKIFKGESIACFSDARVEGMYQGRHFFLQDSLWFDRGFLRIDTQWGREKGQKQQQGH